MKRHIFYLFLFSLLLMGKGVLADDCECRVQNDDGNASQCSLLWFVYNSVACPEIKFDPGTYEIPLEAALTLNSNGTRIIGNVDANKDPTVTLKVKSVSSGYLVRLTGTASDNGKPTLENLNIQAPGKTGIYIDGNGHILKNVRVSGSKIGVEIKGKNNKIADDNADAKDYNKFFNNTEAGVKIDGGDFNLISQALFYGNYNKSDTDNEFAIQRVAGGNNGAIFKSTNEMAVVGLMVSGQKKPAGVTGFADELDISKFELFQADEGVPLNTNGQGKAYKGYKNKGELAWGGLDDGSTTMRRFGVPVTGLTAVDYYTLTSIDASNDTTEFSVPFSADDEMIIGGEWCLNKDKKKEKNGYDWYLLAIDGYDKYGGEAVCYKVEGNAPIVIPCTGDPWTVDSDLDTMPNGLEDKNFNCNPGGKPDTGETDPFVPNTKCELFPKLPECLDTDKDGIPNITDNCPLIANPNQENGDGDQFGDVCDECKYDFEGADDLDENGNPIDSDGDGTPDICDNCPDKFNNQKYDADGDGIGDACEEQPDNDLDDDGIKDDTDNCPPMDECVTGSEKACGLTYNPGQKDIDKDGVGDVCDNCPYNKNPGQEDDDDDGVGNICEGDADGDGIPDDDDNCPKKPNPKQENGDGDILGDACDNCPDDDNDDQTDTDDDGAGDICDNCSAEPNADQEDLDSDFIGDVCDDDMDGDGIPNIGDNCPSVWNEDQADSDADGDGDRCDIDPSISPDINGLPFSAFGDIEGGGGHVSSQGGCSGDIGLTATAGGASNLLVSIVILSMPISAIFARRRFW